MMMLAAMGTIAAFVIRALLWKPLSIIQGTGRFGSTAADRRTWLTHQQEKILQGTFFAGLLLLAAAFSHDLLLWVFSTTSYTANTYVIKAGGWGAVLLTGVSALYTLVMSAPNPQGQSERNPGKLGKVLLLIAPPLVVAVLLFGVAFASRAVLVHVAQDAEGYIHRFGHAALCLAYLEGGLALYESFVDPGGLRQGTPFTWRRFVPNIVLRWINKMSPDTTPDAWYEILSPRGWARTIVIVCLGAILICSTWEFGDFPLASYPDALEGRFGAAVLFAALLLTFARRQWRISLRSTRPVTLLGMACLTATLCVIGLSTSSCRIALAALLLVCILIGGVIALGWLADPNLISLHGFYKARLARAYMGASNVTRKKETITEAAPGDDIPLKDIWNHDIGGPYHLINASLNLVGGSDLATAQRLAENFVMSRYHCGSARAGYRRTAQYMSGELSLATAVAISGAAASPTMGSRSPSAALSLLLSLFNVRLGFWAPTPSRKRWYEGHARLWPFYLLRETLANTGELGTYCYLTDGGHFDNTGLYALVERGCQKMVVCDCGADPTPTFEDIGNAIRRCRIDFGAEIALHIDDFVVAPSAQGIGSVQVGHGTVEYQPAHLRLLGLDVETQRHGTITWIKPTVTAKSAADVRQYRRANSSFPQQSTADQWYDESQFESYRRLGLESALTAFPGNDGVTSDWVIAGSDDSG